MSSRYFYGSWVERISQVESLNSIIKNNVTMSNANYNSKNNVTLDIDSKYVDLIADKLVQALSNPGARTFYCKVAWSLPENIIWNNLGDALKGREPKKLFSWLCKRELEKL